MIIQHDQLNIPLLIMQRELLDTEYIIKEHGINIYNTLIRNYGSLTKAKHELGIIKGLYTGNFNTNRLSQVRNIYNQASNNRLCQAAGIEDSLIGRMARTGNLIGPYNYYINHYDQPFIPINWGAAVITQEGYGITTGIVDTLKALIMLHGEEILYQLKAWDENQERINLAEEIDFNARGEPNMLDIELRGTFQSRAGNYTITSASGQMAESYAGSVMQPAMIINGEIVIHQNMSYSSGSPRKQLDINTKPENWKMESLIKQDLAFILGLKKGTRFCEEHGHNLSIKFPTKRNNAEQLSYLSHEGTNYELLTLYTPIEQEEIFPGAQNEIFNQVLGLAAKMYYIDQQPMRTVDYHILNKYWDLIITPKLTWSMIGQSENLEERIKHTARLSGSYILGELTNQGNQLPYIAPEYSIQPQVINNEIITPLPLGKIKVKFHERPNQEAIKNAKVTILPYRSHKIFKCENPNCCCYGGYYREPHNHKQLPNHQQLTWDGNQWTINQ